MIMQGKVRHENEPQCQNSWMIQAKSLRKGRNNVSEELQASAALPFDR